MFRRKTKPEPEPTYRYLTLGGAVASVYASSSAPGPGYWWKCEGCGDGYDDYRYNDKQVLRLTQAGVNRHAANCRAMPRRRAT